MTRIIIIIATAVVAFGGGFLGMLLTMPSVAPTKVAEADSLAAEVVITNLPAPAPAPDTLAISPTELVVALEDSLSTALSELDNLRNELDSMRSSRASKETHAANVAALSSTLPKLEADELGAILEKLDIVTLETLYQAATARNRTIILQALPPERAAEFVRRMVDPNVASLPALDTP